MAILENPTKPKKTRKVHIMDFLLKSFSSSAPKVGDLVDGKVIGQRGPSLFVDLTPYGSGIIYGREFYQARDIVKNLHAGDTVTAKVVELENEDGYIELSLKEAGKEMVWREAQEVIGSGKPLDLKVVDINKGGLVLEWEGLTGFLPVSQLKPKHYPRVEGGDKDKILDELKKFLGETITVTIIAAEQEEDKLIFSEKGTQDEELKEMVSKYKVGDIVEGEITGVVDFGIFVKIEEGLEGLAHISELDWSLVEDPHQLYKVGDKIKAKIIGIENGKISLSFKALKPDPWAGVEKKYKKGDIVEAVVIRFNKYGALVSIEEGVAGLLHVSEFGSEKEMKEKIELGKTYPFQISVLEPQERKLILTYLEDDNKSKEEKDEDVKT